MELFFCRAYLQSEVITGSLNSVERIFSFFDLFLGEPAVGAGKVTSLLAPADLVSKEKSKFDQIQREIE